jgi:Transposase, Mutator family
VVATSYLLGVSTRRMEKLVEQRGITRLSKSQVSIMAKDLDAQAEAFRTRPLDAGLQTDHRCTTSTGHAAGGDQAGAGAARRRGKFSFVGSSNVAAWDVAPPNAPPRHSTQHRIEAQRDQLEAYEGLCRKLGAKASTRGSVTGGAAGPDAEVPSVVGESGVSRSRYGTELAEAIGAL